MNKKKKDPLSIALYALLAAALLYVSAALGAAMDLSVGDDGALDFGAVMSNIEGTVTQPDVVAAHFADFSGYSAKITIMVAFALGIYVLMKMTGKKRLHRKGVEHGSARLFRYVARHRVALLAKLRKHRVCDGLLRRRRNFLRISPKRSHGAKPSPMRTERSTPRGLRRAARIALS